MSEVPDVLDRYLPLLYLVVAGIPLVGAYYLLPQFVADDAFLHRLQVAVVGSELLATAVLIHGLGWWRRTAVADAETRRAANRDVLQLLFRVIRHDLRNDLTLIQGYVRSIAETVSDPPEEYDRLLATTDELVDDIEKVVTLRRVAGDEVQPREVDLVPIVTRQVEQLRASEPDAEVTVETPDTARVEAVPPVEVAVEEVLENAVAHHPDSPSIHVAVETDAEAGAGESVAIRMTDDGPGIPAIERQVLQEGEENQLLHSSGIGLWLVYWVVTRSGGRLEFDTDDPQGSVVTLVFPAASSELDHDRLVSTVEEFMR